LRFVRRIPFQELEYCPQCGWMELEKVHNRVYPDERGWVRVVVYRCLRCHAETFRRQLVVEQADVPPKHLWEGYV
jgi:hypothetical protein